MHPRSYISYSQLITWENDPNGYARKYFHGEQGRTNRGQALGREFAEALESGEETGKAELDIVIAQMPKYKIRDKEIMCKLGVGKGKDRKFIPMLIKPDTVTEDFRDFKEYKTGVGPWTQAIVDEDDQITFYATGLYLRIRFAGGVDIPRGELVWAPTEKRIDGDGVERPHLTGEIKRFPTTRSFADILNMQARIARAWRQIGEAMEKEIL